MNCRNVVRFCAVAVILAAPSIARAAQQAGHNMPGMAQQPAASAAAGECMQAQPRVTQTIDAANARLDVARQTNSPAAMRAALDDLQGALGSLRAQLAPCASAPAVAPAGGHTGHAMPGMPNVQQSPATQPGTPVMQPGTTQPAPGAVKPNAPAPAGGAPAADPHAGHAMQGGAATSARVPGNAATMPAGHAMPMGAGGVGATTALVRDPRCASGNINPETAPRAEHGGQAYYFCTETARQLFVTDPAAYLAGGAAARPAPAGGGRPAAKPAAAADSHAGHAMPTVASPAAQAPVDHSNMPGMAGMRTAGAQAKPAVADHSAHAMPSSGTAGASGTSAAPGAAGPPAASAATLASGRRPATAVGDLRCASTVEPKTAPRMLHGGQMYYFCSAEDRAEFAKNPQRYVTAAPAVPGGQAAPAHAH